MRINQGIGCTRFPCTDIQQACYQFSEIDLDPTKISMILISETVPQNPADHYYASGSPLFQQITLLAFQDAGIQAGSIQELVQQGIYFTTAVKCAKTGYGVQPKTVEECSSILEQELAQFPNVKVFMLMGDVAIKALNYIARKNGEGRVIPAGSTYKIRKQEFHFRGKRVFPSYLQAGPSFFIEKSKRRMIAEDLTAALALLEF